MDWKPLESSETAEKPEIPSHHNCMTKVVEGIPGKELCGLRGDNGGKIKSCMKCKIQLTSVTS